MQRQKTLEFWVGIFVILGFAALLFMALQSANLGSFSFGHKTYAVTAEFDNIGGLKPRAAVKSAGVVVGRVRSVEFDPETFMARVTMDLEQKYAFPADSSAKIRRRSQSRRRIEHPPHAVGRRARKSDQSVPVLHCGKKWRINTLFDSKRT